MGLEQNAFRVKIFHPTLVYLNIFIKKEKIIQMMLICLLIVNIVMIIFAYRKEYNMS